MARLQATISTIAHQERPEYLDRLSVLREQIFTLDHMYMSVFSTAGWILRLGITVALLATVNPVLVTLVLFAIPTVAATSWRPVVERTAQERARARGPAGKAPVRAVDHTPRPARNCGCSASAPRSLSVAGRRGSAGTGRWPRPGSHSSVWYAGGWAVFALGLRRSDRARRDRAARLAGVGHPRAHRRRQALLLRRRHGQRDRLPARHLDGRIAAAGLA